MQVGLGNLDLDDREAPLRIDRHQVGAAAVGKGHLADSEQVLAAEQPSDSARDFGRDRRSVGKAGRLGLRGHRLTRTKRGQKESGRAEARPLLIAILRSSAVEDVIADRGDPLHVPAGRDIARVEEERVADRRFLEALIDDLGDRDSGLPLLVRRARHAGSEWP